MAFLLAAGGVYLLVKRASGLATEEVIEKELAEYLAREFPSLEMDRSHPGDIRIATPEGGRAIVAVQNIVGDAREHDLDGRQRVYGSVARAIRSAITPSAVPLAMKLGRVFPQVVHKEFTESVLGRALLSVPLGETPLRVCYVVEDKGQVEFISKPDQAKERVSEADIIAAARDNAKALVSIEQFEKITRSSKANIVDGDDVFNATRLLVIMEYLKPGQVLAVALPDRDTLVIWPNPDAAAWLTMEKVAKKPFSSRLIFDRPLRVTSQGIEVH